MILMRANGGGDTIGNGDCAVLHSPGASLEEIQWVDSFREIEAAFRGFPPDCQDAFRRRRPLPGSR